MWELGWHSCVSFNISDLICERFDGWKLFIFFTLKIESSPWNWIALTLRKKVFWNWIIIDNQYILGDQGQTLSHNKEPKAEIYLTIKKKLPIVTERHVTVGSWWKEDVRNTCLCSVNRKYKTSDVCKTKYGMFVHLLRHLFLVFTDKILQIWRKQMSLMYIWFGKWTQMFTSKSFMNTEVMSPKYLGWQ